MLFGATRGPQWHIDFRNAQQQKTNGFLTKDHEVNASWATLWPGSDLHQLFLSYAVLLTTGISQGSKEYFS